MKYYAVKNGKLPGIYKTWDEAKLQVHGFKGAVYKSFKTMEEAENYINNADINNKIIETANNDEAIVYVDGSYAKDKTFSYGYVIIYNGEVIEGAKRFNNPEYADFRNVAGEVLGSIAAIEKSLDLNIKKIFLHHDYTGIRHWALKEWKANNKLTQNYRDFFESIKDKIEVEFIKVDAHTGIKYNEMVDKLAKNAKL